MWFEEKIVKYIHGNLEFCFKYLSITYNMANIWLNRAWSQISETLRPVKGM